MKVVCDMCGVEFNKCPSTVFEHNFCCRDCSNKWNSIRFSANNKIWNKTKMTDEVKEKLRERRLGVGEGKAYRKLFGKHLHRQIAEQTLGRPLKDNEIVHHIDGNKLNNSPENLQVMTQAEHARLHFTKVVMPNAIPTSN